MLFQTNMTCFLLQNTHNDIMKNVDNQTIGEEKKKKKKGMRLE